MSAVSASASSPDVPSPPPSSSLQGRPSPSSSIVVSNLSSALTLPHLEDLFSTIGPVHSLRWHQPHPTSERLCVVDFVHAKHADTALLITDTDIGDKRIRIEKFSAWQASHADTTAPAAPQPPPSPSPPVPANATAAVADPQTQTQTQPPIIAPPPAAAAPAPPQPSALTPNAGSAAAAAAQIAQSMSVAPPLIIDPTFTSGTIYVGNLSPQVTDAILHVYFSQLGPLVGTKMQSDAASPNRFAFVEFEQPMVAQAALALHGQLLMGRAMKIGKANTGVGRTGAGVLSAEERLARAAAMGRGVSDKVTSALAKVAAAQESIANKLGVKVQTPVTVTAASLLEQLGVPLSAVTAAAQSTEGAAGPAEKPSGGGGGGSRSRSPGDAADRRKFSSSRSHRRHSSSSRSHSRSASASRSASRSRSPRRRRHHRSRGRGDSRERSSERRSHHHRSSRRRSSSPSPTHRKGRTGDEDKKMTGEAQAVGADRWRAEDGEEVEGEEKEVGGDARPSHSSRERRRSSERRSSRSRERDRSPAHSHRRSRDDYRSSSRHGRRGWSDDEDSSSSRFGRRGGGDYAHRHRRKVGPDPHAGMVWDGFTWNPASLAPAALPNGV